MTKVMIEITIEGKKEYYVITRYACAHYAWAWALPKSDYVSGFTRCTKKQLDAMGFLTPDRIITAKQFS